MLYLSIIKTCCISLTDGTGESKMRRRLAAILCYGINNYQIALENGKFLC